MVSERQKDGGGVDTEEVGETKKEEGKRSERLRPPVLEERWMRGREPLE